MVKLFLKNANLCDHNPPTLQTAGRTDRQTTCDRNTALCTKVHRRAVKIEHNTALYMQLYQKSNHTNRTGHSRNAITNGDDSDLIHTFARSVMHHFLNNSLNNRKQWLRLSTSTGT